MTSGLRIGFIGLGKMGSPMAQRLLDAGFSLVVRDVRREAAETLLESGAQWADSPREVAENSDVVCTSLPGPSAAEEVYLGADGIVGAARPGLIAVDFTTNAPPLVQRIAAELGARNATLLDAPVSGGVEGARSGKLTLLVGGEKEVLDRCQTLLDVLAASPLPRLAVVTLVSADLPDTAQTLRARGVALRETSRATLVVPPQDACGVVLEFRAADGNARSQ